MNTANTTTEERLRKAAIFVASLDAHAADLVLDRMPPEQAARIRRLLMEMGDADPVEQQRVLEEFSQHGADHDVDGVEIAPELAQRLAQGTASSPVREAEASPTYSPPSVDPSSLQLLSQLPPAALAKRLHREHPQTIAVVAAHLPPALAAELLGELSADLQQNVVKRLANLDLADPSVVQEIASELEATLVAAKRQQHRRSAGQTTLAEILQAASRENRRNLLSTVARHDRELADHLETQAQLLNVAPAWAKRRTVSAASANSSRESGAKPPAPSPRSKTPFTVYPAAASDETDHASSLLQIPQTADPPAIELTFDDLATLDDRSLGRVLQKAGPQIALLALAGASPEFVQRMLRPLPAAEATHMRDKIEQLGAVRLRDIEAAQAELARVAGVMAARNEIAVVRRTRFAAAA